MTGRACSTRVSWFEYGRLDDHPRCVCPVVAAYAREVNDLLPDDWRQRLKPFILRLPGTVDPAAVLPRAEFLMWQAVRVFAPLALETVASVHPDRHHAATLRGHAAAMRATGTPDAARAANAAVVAATNAAALDAVRTTEAAARVASATARTATAITATRAATTAARAAWTAFEAKDTATLDEIHTLCITALDGVLKIGERAPPIGIETIARANRSFALAARTVGVT